MDQTETTTSGGSLRGRRICIVGAGIGGLTAALAFAQSGATVQVFEQAPEFSEIGAGIQISPNGMRVLNALGVGGYISRIGVVSQAVAPSDGLTGKAVTRFDLRGQAPAYHFVHRAELIDLLSGACMERGIELNVGCRVISATPQGGVSYVDILSETPIAQKAAGDLVVFADGIKSIGRVLTGNLSEPEFSGQVAWRAIVPGTMPPEAQILMGPGQHMVVYPIGDNQLNIVAVQERDAWAQEGWSHQDDPQNLRDAFAPFAANVADLLARVDEVNLWGLFRHPVAQRWHMGRVVVLGDAAHPTLPFLAQGANLAIEDAYVLARCCDEDGALETALQRYQSLRMSRVGRAIAAANANAKSYHLSGFKRKIAHTGLKVLGQVAPYAFLNRLDWLYGHDVTLDRR